MNARTGRTIYYVGTQGARKVPADELRRCYLSQAHAYHAASRCEVGAATMSGGPPRDFFAADWGYAVPPLADQLIDFHGRPHDLAGWREINDLIK